MSSRPKLPWPLHPECCWSYRPEKVVEYIERLKAGSAPPEVVLVLVDDKMQLLDGVHRAEAWFSVYGNFDNLPSRFLEANEDPGVYLHKIHQGTRQLSIHELAAQVLRRVENVPGMTEERAIKEASPGVKYERMLKASVAKAKLPPVEAVKPKLRRQPEELVRVIIPDSHGQHIDPDAEEAFLLDLLALDPVEIVFLGDHVDAGGTFSAHQRSYTHEKTESYEDDTAACNRFFDSVQNNARRATGLYYTEGNHEQHIERWATRNFESHKDAEMVVKHLGPANVLKLASRGIQYFKRSEMYMGLAIPGTIKLGECFFVHGISHAKNADSQHLARFGHNVVFGHVHRVQGMNERTVMSAGFGAWCPGTLAKLQPLYRHTEPTSWSHGYAVQFVNRSGAFLHVNVPIHKGISLLPSAFRRGVRGR